MFDLDKAISAWRRTLEHTRAVSAEDLRELECHVRDQVDWLCAEGYAEEDAFARAVREAGDFGTTAEAYEKVYWRKARHRGRLLETLFKEADMLASYLKTALRTLRRQPGYTLLNVAGLAVGLACCLLIAVYVRHEHSYDRFHAKADRIFRVVAERTLGDDVRRMANSAVPLGPTLEAELPGVERAVRFWHAFQPVVHHGPEHRQEDGLYFTDPAVFDVFSFDLVAGDPRTALAQPGSVVLTEATARRYFGGGEPVGRALRFTGFPADTLDLTVTGVVRDLPANTQFAFDFLVSLAGVETEADNFGSFKPIWTYVLLAPGTRPEAMAAPLAAFTDRHVHAVTRSNARYRLSLEPLVDVHLRSDYTGGFVPGSSRRYVSLLAAVGLFILLLAAINFTNLSTARSLRRAREVGVRKVLGAHRAQLAGQFLGEAFVVTGLAVAAAVVLAHGLLPLFNALSGTTLTLGFTRDAFAAAALGGLALLIGVLAGAYPALVLSAFRPVAVLKGQPGGRGHGARLRQALVVFQFAVSSTLMIGTAVVYRQLDYVRSRSLGFDREHVVVLPYSPAEGPLVEALRREPAVRAVTVTQRVPASPLARDGRPVRAEGLDEVVQVESYIADAHFVPTLGLTLAAGRPFSEALPTDAGAFLVNEAAVKAFGWGSPEAALGKEVDWGFDQKRGPVVGVVRDFATGSLHEAIPPVVIQMMPEAAWWRTYLAVRLAPGDVRAALERVEALWRRHTPDGAYDAFFLDAHYEALYRADERFGRLFGALTLLALLVACLGLFGLAAYAAEQRTREIGVRKVLGATAAGIVLLLARDFLRLVAVAFVVAAPVAYLGMGRWLDGFAYRAPLSWELFALSGLASLAVAGLTVGYQALRAALTDPARALRYE